MKKWMVFYNYDQRDGRVFNTRREARDAMNGIVSLLEKVGYTVNRSKNYCSVRPDVFSSWGFWTIKKINY